MISKAERHEEERQLLKSLEITDDILVCEDALLSAILIDPSEINVVRSTTCGAEFMESERGRMFDVLVAAFDAGEPVGDLTWLRTELPKRGVYESLCSSEGLLRLLKNAPHRSHSLYYATEIRKRHLMNQVVSYCVGAIHKAQGKAVDPAEVRASLEANLSTLGADTFDGPRHIGEVMRGASLSVGDRDTRLRVFTGITDLDNAMGPMCSGEMVVLAARTSQGKTALAMQIAWHNAERGRPVLFISLEMTQEELALRKLAALAGVDSRMIRSGRVRENDIRKLQEIAADVDAPLYVWAPSVATMPQIRGMAKSFSASEPLQLVVIDYIGLVATRGMHREAKQFERVAAVSHDIKALAKELRCPVIALCQLNREAEGVVPNLSQLAQSGAIEQDADFIIFPYRDRGSKHPPDEEGGTPASLIVAKHRNGSPCEVEARWIGQKTEYANKYMSAREWRG